MKFIMPDLTRVACSNLLTYEQVLQHWREQPEDAARVFSWPEGREYRFVERLEEVQKDRPL